VDELGDPIHAISLKMISRVVDGTGALAGNMHGTAGSTAGVDDDADADGEEEVCAIALSPESSSSTVDVNATLDCVFATLFFADEGDVACAGACGAAATPAFAAAPSVPASGSIVASDELSAAKRSLSEMVSTPALFIPNALLIAEG
jgi:hypothetical protein